MTQECAGPRQRLPAASLDPAAHAMVVDDVTRVVPCMATALFLYDGDDEGVLEWHDRALDALGTQITHHSTPSSDDGAPASAGRRRRVTARNRGLLAGWMARPPSTRNYDLLYFGCAEGVSATGASVHWLLRRLHAKPPEFVRRWMARWRREAEAGHDVRRALPCVQLRLTLPLDHPFAAPDALYR